MSLKRPLTSFFHGLMLAAWLLASAAVSAQGMVSIDRAKVNMREGAGTGHAALWTLARGYPLKVTGREGHWLQVQDFEGDTGWVLARLTGRKAHMVVKVDRANIRKGPSTRQRIVGSAQYGEVLRTLEQRGSWVRVRQTEGATGWVARRLLWGW